MLFSESNEVLPKCYFQSSFRFGRLIDWLLALTTIALLRYYRLNQEEAFEFVTSPATASN